MYGQILICMIILKKINFCYRTSGSERLPVLPHSTALLKVSSNGLTFCKSWNNPTSSQFLMNLVGVGVWSAKFLSINIDNKKKQHSPRVIEIFTVLTDKSVFSITPKIQNHIVLLSMNNEMILVGKTLQKKIIKHLL